MIMRRPSRSGPLLLALLLVTSACAGTRVNHSETYGARKGMAYELVRRGDWPRAFSMVDGLFREDPKDPEVLALRGLIYREQKLFKEAETDLVEALELKGDYAFAHANLAILLDLEARAPEALEHHRRAAELERQNAGYLNNLGFSTFAHGRPREAIPIFQEALRLDPTNARIRNNLGFAYARAGDFPHAAEHFAMGGSPATAKNNLGYAYQTASNWAQAFDSYVEALRLEPGLSRARRNLHEVARRLGRPVPADLPPEPSRMEGT
jgi:Flp pilus assembly protein TadD